MRVSILALIEETSPERPPCFASDALFHSYLNDLHHQGYRVVQRVDVNQGTPQRRTFWRLLPVDRIPYCTDCDGATQHQMQVAGRCSPCRDMKEILNAAAQPV